MGHDRPLDADGTPPDATRPSGPEAESGGAGGGDAVDDPPGGQGDPTGHDTDGDLAEYAELSIHQLAELTEQAGEPSSQPQRRWVLPVRILVSIAMLGVLIWKVPDFNLDELLPNWSPGVGAWLAGAIALTAAGVVLAAVRWAQVLRALDRPARLRRLTSICFAGQFVSNVLPTTIGGDVLRVARLARDNGDSAGTFASVALERLTGWLVLPLLAYLGFALNRGLATDDPATGAALAAVTIALVGLALILVAAQHPRLGGRMRNRQGWRRFLGAVHAGVDTLRRRPKAAARVIIAGLAYQFVLCGAAWMAAQALDLDQVGLTVMLAFYPAVLMTQVLPLGIAGLGLREISFTLFLQPLGVAPERAIALGLVLYLINVGVSLLGAPAFAVERRAPGPARIGSVPSSTPASTPTSTSASTAHGSSNPPDGKTGAP